MWGWCPLGRRAQAERRDPANYRAHPLWPRGCPYYRVQPGLHMPHALGAPVRALPALDPAFSDSHSQELAQML
jgi:hypothetical protein